MKIIVIIFTLAFFVSCGNESKRSEGQFKDSEQNVNVIDTANIDEAEEASKPIGTGMITTIADGFDVRRVNLFSSTNPDRTINCYLSNGDRVNILEDAEPYYLVEAIDKQGCKGYCMKGFVILNNSQ